MVSSLLFVTFINTIIYGFYDFCDILKNLHFTGSVIEVTFTLKFYVSDILLLHPIKRLKFCPIVSLVTNSPEGHYIYGHRKKKGQRQRLVFSRFTEDIIGNKHLFTAEIRNKILMYIILTSKISRSRHPKIKTKRKYRSE